MVSLSQELAFIENYLCIEKARFGDRLRLSLPEPGTVPDIDLPGLTLQPLVENAIRYGVARLVDGGTVEVIAVRNGKSVEVKVKNQFDPADGLPDLCLEKLFCEGHALANVRQRLSLIYGNGATLEVTQDGPDSVVGTVRLPI
jgi:LytS/YehU family sensor histidine kinase